LTAHALPQFTPAQVLDAGRRAEAEGRFEFAQQFYRHLVTYYANSQEAAEAQDGLRRLGGHAATPGLGPDHAGKPGPDLDASTAGPPPLEPAFGGAARPSYGSPTPAPPPRDGAHPEPSWGPGSAQPAPQHVPPAANGVQPHMRLTAQLPPAQPLPYPPPSRPDRRHEAWPGAREARAPFEPPPPVHGFRTGRIMARLCTWCGGLIALAGCAAVPVSILSPRALQAVPVVGAWVTGLGFGAGIIATGLVMIVIGQIVRALLEQANAMRDMAAITRARAEYDSDAGGRRSPG
jgi:hypothetical protein